MSAHYIKRFMLIALSFSALKLVANPIEELPPLRSVDFVNPLKYVGRWYQISANPLPFEAGCVCSQQTLKIINPNELSVYNSCNRNSPDGPFTDISGVAYNDNPQTNSQFTVDFGLGFFGKYWIIAVDRNYRWAVVSDPDRRSLYVLSKTPKLSKSLYKRAIRAAKKQTDVSKLVLNSQENCTYPPVDQ